MADFKLQLGCLVIILYIIAVYLKDSVSKKLYRNPIFDAMLFICPWAVIFDGLTVWTVNHMDIVPAWLNLLLNVLFFLSMEAVIVTAYVYMLDITNGLPKKRRFLALLLLPAMVSVVIILAFIGRTYYVEGTTTNYSMGISVIACYISLVVHFLLILGIVAVKRRNIEKRKLLSIFSFLALTFAFLVIQVIYPETFVSSMFPTMLILGVYINLEDPSYRRLEEYNSDMVTGFATLVENRDNSTGGHIKRTRGYVRIILSEMSREPKYRKIITRDYVNNVKNAAPMHDIGKIATPDRILQKPGKLTDEEFEIMKRHAADGGKIIMDTFADLDNPEFTRIAYEVARYHHEKWNGRGYPEGLKGEEIPLHARIMAIADVFDAVSAKRCYRDAMPIETCFKIIEDGAGKDFDPDLVPLFMRAREKVMSLYLKDRDKERKRKGKTSAKA